MKRLMCACLLVLAVFATPASAQDDKPHPFFDPLASKLRAVRALSNYDRGFGSRNDFYLLSKEFLEHRTVKDFERMAGDRSPVVRAMGLLCLAQAGGNGHYLTLALHLKDKEELYLYQGCVVSKVTVGEFARRLLSNPYFLEPEGRRPAV